MPQSVRDHHFVFQSRCSQRVTMARFQTVIKYARFVYSPYTATEMQSFAQVLADAMRTRIQSGQNIHDQAAPLKPEISRLQSVSCYSEKSRSHHLAV
jgi:hypothetical protein